MKKRTADLIFDPWKDCATIKVSGQKFTLDYQDFEEFILRFKNLCPGKFSKTTMKMLKEIQQRKGY